MKPEEPTEPEDCNQEGYVLDDEGNCQPALNCGSNYLVVENECVCPEGSVDNGYECLYASSPNKLCGNYRFIQTGDGLTAEIVGLAYPAYHHGSGEFLNGLFGAICLTYGESTNIIDSSGGSEIFNLAWDLTMDEAEIWLNSLPDSPTEVEYESYVLGQLLENLEIGAEGYIALSTGPCVNIPSSAPRYCN